MKAIIFIFNLFSILYFSDHNIVKNIIVDDKNAKESAIFKYDKSKKIIISPAKGVETYLNLQFISLTTDQPIYWPDEEVFLKIVYPNYPNKNVKINLQKKDATEKELGTFELNDYGILVYKILSGKEKKIEPGEYKVTVFLEDKKVQSTATFSVVEGTLGSVSFAFDFEQITDPAKLKEVKGGWYLGNAAGVGMRWGNGLNVKNEVRVFNKPYNGKVTIKSRCYLPGCNGIEAGHSLTREIKDGQLETVLDIGGHSGPFEIEVITDRGNVRNLFAQSGHVERQSTPVSSNLTNIFNITLAPYEKTIPVEGRGLFIEKQEGKKDPVELISPICDNNNEIELKIHETLINPKMYIFYPDKENSFSEKEINLKSSFQRDETIKVKCQSPYTFVIIGGFKEKSGELYEGWCLAFSEPLIESQINMQEKSNPLSTIEIEVKTFEKKSKNGIPICGILEVYDNRVPSKSAREPLISSIGDSYRNLSNYLVSWRDYTGISYEKEVAADAVPAPSANKVSKRASSSVYRMKTSIAGSSFNISQPSTSEEENPQFEETIREGEKKVVYCSAITTDKNGIAKVMVQLPPQTGRCKARFIAINRFDYFESIKSIDVQKGNSVEADVQRLLMPDSKILVNAIAGNIEQQDMILKIFGGGIKDNLTINIPPGSRQIEFEMTGLKYGDLRLELTDKNGKIVDSRKYQIKNLSSLPVTFSEIFISNEEEITIDPGHRIEIYNNPASLLKGILMNVVTTTYSWFGHSEALSAGTALRAIILRAISEKIIDDEGLRETIKSDFIKTIKDLNEKFINQETGEIYPYPGVNGKAIWAVWALNNLNKTIKAFEGNKNLSDEFAPALEIVQKMTDKIKYFLNKNDISTEEESFINKEGVDVIPIEVDGKIIYKAITDDAVSKWFVKNVIPSLDIPHLKDQKDLNLRFTKLYDKYRFLRAFERVGNIYYLLLNAKSLYLNDDKNFPVIFNKISKGFINTQEPGLIQGPALLGGVYSSPQTLLKYLELLIEISIKHNEFHNPLVEIISKDGNKKVEVGKNSYIIEPSTSRITIKAPKYVTIRSDQKQDINIYSYLKEKSFFQIKTDNSNYKVGSEYEMNITLDSDRDPNEYYALIAVPSVLSIRQTDDLLSDYKGQLLYGQRTGGGEKIQMLTLPFRGSRNITIRGEASYKGSSNGYVLVRHISNPDIIETLKTGKIIVQ